MNMSTLPISSCGDVSRVGKMQVKKSRTTKIELCVRKTYARGLKIRRTIIESLQITARPGLKYETFNISNRIALSVKFLSSLSPSNAFFSNYFKSRDFHLTCTEQHHRLWCMCTYFAADFFSEA